MSLRHALPLGTRCPVLIQREPSPQVVRDTPSNGPCSSLGVSWAGRPFLRYFAGALLWALPGHTAIRRKKSSRSSSRSIWAEVTAREAVRIAKEGAEGTVPQRSLQGGQLIRAVVTSIDEDMVTVDVQGLTGELRKRQVSQLDVGKWDLAEVFAVGESITCFVAYADDRIAQLRTDVLEGTQPGLMVRKKAVCFAKAAETICPLQDVLDTATPLTSILPDALQAVTVVEVLPDGSIIVQLLNSGLKGWVSPSEVGFASETGHRYPVRRGMQLLMTVVSKREDHGSEAHFAPLELSCRTPDLGLRQGDLVQATIADVFASGIVVEIEGLYVKMKKWQLSQPADSDWKPYDFFKVGEVITCYVAFLGETSGHNLKCIALRTDILEGNQPGRLLTTPRQKRECVETAAATLKLIMPRLEVGEELLVTVLQVLPNGHAIVRLPSGAKGTVSKVDMHENPSSLLGQEVPMQVIDPHLRDQGHDKHFTSVRLSYQRSKLRTLQADGKVKQGYIVEAVVVEVSSARAVVSLDGFRVDLNKRDISKGWKTQQKTSGNKSRKKRQWSFKKTVADVFTPGEAIKCYVSEVDAERGLIRLSTAVLEGKKWGRMLRDKKICFDRADAIAREERKTAARELQQKAVHIEPLDPQVLQYFLESRSGVSREPML